MTRVVQLDPIEAITDYLYHNALNGASVSTDGYAPMRGFMVGGEVPAVAWAPRNVAHSVATIRRFVSDHWPQVSALPGVYFGVWYDQAAGRYYLDVSREVLDRQEAETLARHRGELAIFDVVHRKEVRI